ncbi:ATP cone domain-containing protein [Candidatus Auribacterota bacterium]
MQNTTEKVTFVKKRDGSVVPFEKNKIADAIFKAIASLGGHDRLLADELSESVTLYLNKMHGGSVPDIETIQDMVERVLIEMGQVETAKSYIIYREKRAQLRKAIDQVQEESGSGEIDWDRKKVLNAIMIEVGLPYILAEKVVDVVEDTIGDRNIPPEQMNLSIN